MGRLGRQPVAGTGAEAGKPSGRLVVGWRPRLLPCSAPCNAPVREEGGRLWFALSLRRSTATAQRTQALPRGRAATEKRHKKKHFRNG